MEAPLAERAPLPREIAVRYIPVVRGIALSVCRRLPSHISVDDLIGAGFVGLVKAYRGHDNRAEGFQAYAEQRIRGAMLDELRALDPLTREQRALARGASAAAKRLEGVLGRAPTRDETAAELGVPAEALEANAAQVSASSSASVSADDRGHDKAFDVADGSHQPADEALSAAEDAEALRVAMEALPARLRQVLGMYYGDGVTLRDIGAILGVTESRASQLHHEALERLRKGANSRGLSPRASREVPLRFRRPE